ncbi:MAG: zf-HC2 domain-containing protein, partial [Planctomycetota bacterium]
MNCKEIKNKLSEYLDKELEPEEYSEVSSHIKQCKTCASELETLKRTVELVSSLPRVSAPPELAGILQHKVRARKPALMTKILSLASAAAVVLIAVLFIVNIPNTPDNSLILSKTTKPAGSEIITKENGANLSKGSVNTDGSSAQPNKPVKIITADKADNKINEDEKKNTSSNIKEETHRTDMSKIKERIEDKNRNIDSLDNGFLEVKKSPPSSPLKDAAAEADIEITEVTAASIESIEPRGLTPPREELDKLQNKTGANLYRKYNSKEIHVLSSDVEADVKSIESLIAQNVAADSKNTGRINIERNNDGSVSLTIYCVSKSEYKDLLGTISHHNESYRGWETARKKREEYGNNRLRSEEKLMEKEITEQKQLTESNDDRNAASKIREGVTKSCDESEKSAQVTASSGLGLGVGKKAEI